MRGRVIVDDEKDFQAWLATQPTYAQTRAAAAGDAAAGQAPMPYAAPVMGRKGKEIRN